MASRLGTKGGFKMSGLRLLGRWFLGFVVARGGCFVDQYDAKNKKENKD